MNEFEKAYGELWSVLHNEPASEIEKRRIENIKLLESLKPLVKRATSRKPVLANGSKCPNCCTLMQWEYPYCPFCGQAIDWSE